MKLEEAVEILQKTVKSNNEVIKEARKNGDINVMQLTADLDNQSIAIETVLQELRNSIPKKKIEDKVKHLVLLKRHISLNDDDREIFELCIKEIQELLEGK